MNFYSKYFIDPLDEMKAVRKLIYETKKYNKEDPCFTLELFGKIKAVKTKKLKKSVNVYCAEVPDNESFTEYYYLDLEGIQDFDADKDNEEIFRLLALGEIDPIEASRLCEMS